MPRCLCACVLVLVVAIPLAAPVAAQEIWSASLTVGQLEYTTDRGNERRLFGYKAVHGDDAPGFTDESFGALSEVGFMFAGVTYTITGLYTEDFETQGALFVHVQPPISVAGASFAVDGDTFTLRDAAYHGPVGCCPGDGIVW